LRSEGLFDAIYARGGVAALTDGRAWLAAMLGSAAAWAADLLGSLEVDPERMREHAAGLGGELDGVAPLIDRALAVAAR
jgi:hypothetical protein